MTDICLISPPSRAYNHFRPPLALMLLSSFLERNGINSRIIDIKSRTGGSEEHNWIVSQILEQVRKHTPPVVGIPCYTPEFEEVLDLCRRVKEIKGDITIIVGGVHPTLKPDDFFYYGTPVDFAVIGEGEFTLRDLVSALKNGADINGVRGIAYFDTSTGMVVRTPPQTLIHDLDSMPLPAYDKVDMSFYTRPNPYCVRGLLFSSFYVLVGRGCPSQCTFCVSSQLRNVMASGKALRCRSAKNVVDELEHLKDVYKIDAFYFIDDNFTLLPKLVEEICDEMLDRNIDLKWACSSRINTLSEKLLIKMKRAGCLQIDLGVESGSDEVLKRLKKGIKTSHIKEVFRLCRKVGMRTFCNILINIPGETEEELQETLHLLDEIKPSVTSFNIFIPFLGTEIYDHSGLNLKKEEYPLLGQPPRELVKDRRFKFAKHDVDFSRFYSTNHKKYNSPLVFLPSYFSATYLGHLAKSRRKAEYVRQISLLAKEFFKQVRQ